MNNKNETLESTKLPQRPREHPDDTPPHFYPTDSPLNSLQIPRPNLYQTNLQFQEKHHNIQQSRCDGDNSNTQNSPQVLQYLSCNRSEIAAQWRHQQQRRQTRRQNVSCNGVKSQCMFLDSMTKITRLEHDVWTSRGQNRECWPVLSATGHEGRVRLESPRLVWAWANWRPLPLSHYQGVPPLGSYSESNQCAEHEFTTPPHQKIRRLPRLIHNAHEVQNVRHF